jgi:hypothetical protein
MSPQRIQRKRTRGWRMPEGVIYVGRPTKWGNPWQVGGDAQIVMRDTPKGEVQRLSLVRMWPETVVSLYRLYITHASIYDIGLDAKRLDLSELRGKDLACWCPLSSPCHADVLLELANAGEPS